MILTSLWWIGAGITGAATAYLLLAMAAVAAYRPKQGPGWAIAPKVTLLKPLCGLEDGLEAALATFLAQETTSSVRFVFGVADAADPALALARGIARHFPDREVQFIADPAVHGPNPKVGNLINMAKGGLDEVVAISDSDIALDSGHLQRAIDALAAPGVGAVTALYRGRPGLAPDRTRAFGAWFLDYWFLPMAVLHARLAPLSVTYGPLTLIRRDVLEAAGGLKALADHLSDDAELGKRVRAAGYSVAFTPDIAETLVNDAGHAELFGHELRWARTVRGLDLPGFAASVVSHPGPLPLLLLLGPGWLAAAGVLAPVVLRWLLAGLVARRFGRAENLAVPGPLALWLRDCYCFAVWASAFAVARVGWRGQRLAVEKGDILASGEQHKP
jgi:ceramide glucosyltransferase